MVEDSETGHLLPVFPADFHSACWRSVDTNHPTDFKAVVHVLLNLVGSLFSDLPARPPSFALAHPFPDASVFGFNRASGMFIHTPVGSKVHYLWTGQLYDSTARPDQHFGHPLDSSRIVGTTIDLGV